jgi:hypothetical protein
LRWMGMHNIRVIKMPKTAPAAATSAMRGKRLFAGVAAWLGRVNGTAICRGQHAVAYRNAPLLKLADARRCNRSVSIPGSKYL